MEKNEYMNSEKILGLQDIEELMWLASEHVWHILMRGQFIDDEGNMDILNYHREDYVANDMISNPIFKYLNFKMNEELKKLSLPEVLKLSVEEIKERYLSATLPIIRRSFREDHILDTGMIAGSEISDDYIDTIFCIAWHNDLKIWCVRWEMESKNGTSKI